MPPPIQVAPYRNFILSADHFTVEQNIAKIPEVQDQSINLDDILVHVKNFAIPRSVDSVNPVQTKTDYITNLRQHINNFITRATNPQVKNLLRHLIAYCNSRQTLLDLLEPAQEDRKLAILNALEADLNANKELLAKAFAPQDKELQKHLLNVLIMDMDNAIKEQTRTSLQRPEILELLAPGSQEQKNCIVELLNRTPDASTLTETVKRLRQNVVTAIRKKMVDALSDTERQYYQIRITLRDVMNRLGDTMHHCSNNITPELEAIYMEMILNDTDFLEQNLCRNFLSLVRLAVMQYRDTIFKYACAITSGAEASESGPTLHHARRQIGDLYGIPNPLTQDVIEYASFANDDAIQNVREIFEKDYTIPNIVKNLGERFMQTKDDVVPREKVFSYLGDHYRDYSEVLFDVGANQLSEEAILLILEDANLLVYQGSDNSARSSFNAERRLHLLGIDLPKKE